MRAHEEKSTTRLGPFAEFLSRPEWVVVGGLLVAVSCLFALEISMLAASSIESNVLRRDPLIGLPSNLAMVAGVTFVVLAARSRTTQNVSVLQYSVRVMRPGAFLGGLAGGVVALELADRLSPSRAVPTLWDEFSVTATTVLLILQAGVFVVVFLIGNYSSAMFQALRTMTDEAVRKEMEIRDLQGAIVEHHRASLRDVAAHLHGQVQGRLIRLAQSNSKTPLARELDEIVERFVRPIAHSLYPAELGVSLHVALERLCGDSVDYRPTERFLEHQMRKPEHFPLALRESIYYVALESTTNALKHGEPNTVSLAIDLDGSTLELNVINDDASADRREGSIRPTRLTFGLRLIDAEILRSNGAWSLERRDGAIHFSARFPVEDE